MNNEATGGGKRFKVTIQRTITFTSVVEVEAANERLAAEIAEDKAECEIGAETIGPDFANADADAIEVLKVEAAS